MVEKSKKDKTAGDQKRTYLLWYVTLKCPVSSAELLSEWPTRDAFQWSWKKVLETVT
jgi:hypothetical protein